MGENEPSKPAQTPQPAQAPTPSSSVKKPKWIFNGVILIIVFVLGIIIGIGLSSQEKGMNVMNLFVKPTTVPKPTKAPTPTEVPTPTAASIPTPTPFKVGVLTFPTPNATLCIGKNYSIAWLVPPDTQTVSLEVLPPSGLPHRLVTATNPGSSNDTNSMNGSYIWNAGQTQDNAVLPSNPGYRLGIIVSGNSNASYENYGNYFTLTNCQQ